MALPSDNVVAQEGEVVAMKHWLAVSVLLLLLVISGHAGAAPSRQALEPSELPLAAVFAAWYGYDHMTGGCVGGLGSTHWNDGPNTGGVVYRPDLGYYCSADPAVVTWQLDLLQQMGVRVLIITWWGWGDGNLDGEIDVNENGHIPHDAYMNNGIRAVLDDIRKNDRNMRVALIAEPFPQTYGEISLDGCTPDNSDPCQLPIDKKQRVLDWLWDTYYGNAQYSSLMFEWEGKPLVLAFDPMTLSADDRFTVKHWTGRQKNADRLNEGWQWFFAPREDVIEADFHDGVGWVYPRFDEIPAKTMGADYIFWEPRSIDPYLREGRYEQQWQSLAMHRDSLRMIVLYSWNLYGEQAHVEPSSGCPAAVWDRFVEKTTAYYQALLDGTPIPDYDGSAPGCTYLPLVWQ